MKKFFSGLALLTAVIALASCEDDIFDGGKKLKVGENEVVVAIKGNSTGMGTRSDAMRTVVAPSNVIDLPREEDEMAVSLVETITSLGDSAFVCCSALKEINIPEGETVTAVWRNTSGRTLTYTLSVKVPAAGTLTVYLNGEKLQDVTAAGTTNLTFEGPLAETELAFAYAGTGAAELLTSRCEIGTLLIVR